MDTENQETASNVEGKEHVLRSKHRRNVTSYCDTKTRRTKSSSVLNAEDNNCSPSPTYSEKLKQYPTRGTKLRSCSDLLIERKNETRHENYLADLQLLKQQVTVKRSCSASDSECGTINCPCQEKQEKNCKKSSRHSLVSISKQLNGDDSNTKLKETNVCGQLMKLEKINKDVSWDSTIGKTDDVELEDPASSTTKQTSCRRGRKRKQTAEQETEDSKKVGNNSSDPKDSKVRKFRTRSKSVLDINRSERYLSNISTTLPDPGVLSEMIIPLEASSFSVSSPTPIAVSKSDLSEPNDALELYSTLPTAGKSLESSLFFSSDASQDKSCFSDSADLCLAGIDQSADSDSDEDSPLVLTPVKLDRSFSVNDVVWVKWKQWPYLPALVKKVYKQKKRLTLAVFWKNGLQENFTMGYWNRGSILHYWHPKKAEILAGAMSLSHEDRQQFNDSVAAAEKFLFVGSSLLDDTSLSEPWSCDQPEINNTTDCMDSSMIDATEKTREDKDNLDNVSSCEDVNKCLNRKNGKSRNVACESAEKVRISSQELTPKQKLERKAKSVNESLSMKGVISDASLDKSCFSDSADLCLAGIDQSADSDSDEDSPLVFTPVKLDRSFSVKDVVWVKWKQWPYLPALVKKVYKQKKRLTLAVFWKNGLQENFTMGYWNRGRILHYWHPKKAEILAGAMSLSHEDRQQFNDSVAAAEKFLFVGSSLLDDTSLSEPWSCDQPEINNTTDCMDSSMIDATEKTREDKDTLDNVSSCESVNKCLNRKNGKSRYVACESAEKVRISSQELTPKQKLEGKAKSVIESLSMKGVISDASQDKSCFSDSADLCLAGIDQSADSDSDEDSPLVLTPVKLDRSFSVNDVVWVKWKQWPYLPALVKKVYKQKKRLTLAVFWKNGLQENFTMGYWNRGSILHYWHPKKAEILAGAMSLSHEDRQQFNDSVAAAEKFLFVGSSLLDDTSLSEPWSCDQPEINNTTDCMDSSMIDATEKTREDKDNLDNVSSCEDVNKCLNRKNGKSRYVACESAEKVRISSQELTPKQKLEGKAKSVNESLSMKGVISDASQDKSCFSDSADLCLAGIDQSADSDSDEDSPLVLTPVNLDRSFSVNDVVWVKWKQWPYLPALVKKVYKQKKRLTLAVFWRNGLQENFTMGYWNRGSILHYWHPKKAEILAGAMSLSHEDRQQFNDSVAAAEKFLFVGSSLLDDTSLSEPWSCDQPEINNTTDCMDSRMIDATEKTREDKDNLDNVSSCENVNKCLNRKNGKSRNVACESAEKVRISSRELTPKQKLEGKAKSVNESLSMKGLISDASQDKSCFSDSADLCLAGIDQSADSDSDEDLPLVFTPVKLDRSFSVNDVVWVKWKQWPYLPALVKKVYKQKKRLTLAVFWKNGLQENFTMGYSNRDCILHYLHPKKAEILAGAISLPHEDQQQFNDSVAAAEKFLFVGSSLLDRSFSVNDVVWVKWKQWPYLPALVSSS